MLLLNALVVISTLLNYGCAVEIGRRHETIPEAASEAILSKQVNRKLPVSRFTRQDNPPLFPDGVQPRTGRNKTPRPGSSFDDQQHNERRVSAVKRSSRGQNNGDGRGVPHLPKHNPSGSRGGPASLRHRKRVPTAIFITTDPDQCYSQSTQDIKGCLRYVRIARHHRKWLRDWWHILWKVRHGNRGSSRGRSRGKHPQDGKHPSAGSHGHDKPKQRKHHQKQGQKHSQKHPQKHPHSKPFKYRWNDHWACWTWPRYQAMVWPPVPWAAPPCIELPTHT